jgi:anti-sigma B factor antagonist
MCENALTVTAVRDGPVCSLIVSGDLDLAGTGRLLEPAALAVGARTGRLVLGLAGGDVPGLRRSAGARGGPELRPERLPGHHLLPQSRRTQDHQAAEQGVADSRHAWSGPRPATPTWGREAGRREPGPAGAGATVAAPGVTQMRDRMSSFEVIGGVPVVAAPEEIDITSVPALWSALLEAAAQGHGTLVADMSLTRLCDSSGIHALLAAHKRAKAEGGELLLVIPDTAVLRVYRITGIDRMIPSFTSLDQALAQTSTDGPGSRQRADDAPDGKGNRLVTQHGSWPAGESC